MIDTRLKAGLREAMRLTRTGDLASATAAIQRALHPQAPSGEGVAARPDAPPTARSAQVLDGVFERVDTPDPWASPLLNRARTQGETLAPGARFLTLSYSGEGGGRDYKLYIPSSYRGGQPGWPLVVMLHGCTQSPDDFAAGTRMNQLAEDYRCLVAYPAQASTANGSKCWNWFQPTDQHRDRGEPALIAGITREVLSAYSVDPRRVFIAGLSAGGAMAALMGMNYPELYAAVGVHSGLACGSAKDLPSALSAMRQGATAQERCGRALPSLIVFHGDRDTTVHPANGAQLLAQWRQPPAPDAAPENTDLTHGRVPGGHAYTRSRQRDHNGDVRLEYWQIHGAGHAWSGGSPDGSYTDPRGPDATAQMLQFFYRRT